MTSIAASGCLVDFVAVDTPFHLDGLLGFYYLLQHHFAMTASAFDFCDGMLRVAEEDKVGHFIYAARWNFTLRHVYMAHFALRLSRKPSQVFPFGILMARHTAQL